MSTVIEKKRTTLKWKKRVKKGKNLHFAKSKKEMLKIGISI